MTPRPHRLVTGLGLAVCMSSVWAQDPAATLSNWQTSAIGAPPPPWQAALIPDGTIAPTQFSVVKLGAEQALRISAKSSYGNVVLPWPASAKVPRTLNWTWRLDQAIAAANLQTKAGDDTPLKLCALFDIPLDRLSLVERTKIRIARSVSGQHLPSATLCYVWDAHLPTGTLLANAYTQRLRMLVVDSGDSKLTRWVSHEVQLQADFKRAFGSEFDALPRFMGIAIGADSDNTQSSSLAYVLSLAWAP